LFFDNLIDNLTKHYMQVSGHLISSGLQGYAAMYSKESQKEKKKLTKIEFDLNRKKCYNTFLKSWDVSIGGKMPPSRFYAGTSHLTSLEDWLALRKLYLWCVEKQKPFAPVMYDKFFLKREKEEVDPESNKLQNYKLQDHELQY
jgi:hypothetical protein